MVWGFLNFLHGLKMKKIFEGLRTSDAHEL